VANFVNYYQQGADSDVIGHAHNVFLNVAAERGALGLLSFVTVVGGLFRALRRTMVTARDSLARGLAAGLIATFAGYLIHSLLDVSYYDYKVLLLFWLLAGMAAVAPQMSDPVRV
jgi:putative inorganic carbon (HCO3(-)) transporter